jgi:hypothetical protein
VIDDRGCGAPRLDLSYLKKFPDWQVYLVKESQYMHNNRLTFAVKDTEEGESYEDFITHLSSPTNLQSATITRAGSSKAIKKQIQAMNMFVWPNSI